MLRACRDGYVGAGMTASRAEDDVPTSRGAFGVFPRLRSSRFSSEVGIDERDEEILVVAEVLRPKEKSDIIPGENRGTESMDDRVSCSAGETRDRVYDGFGGGNAESEDVTG